MFTVPCFIAVLTGRRISDVLRPFETQAAAIAQCRAWTRKAVALKEDTIPGSGYVYFAQYGHADETVRVEYHALELAEPGDPDPDEEPAERVVLRELRSLTRGTAPTRAGQEDA